MAGHVLMFPALKGFGLATCAAPYTKVFCQATAIDDGRLFETFAADFQILYVRSSGERGGLQITPELYSKIAGPYNRRNVYGAVLAYAPALPQDLRDSTIRYALFDPGHITTELGLPDDITEVEIVITPSTKGESDSPFIIHASAN